MNRNNHEATPDRSDRVSANVFRTPMNPKPCAWSPILDAVTPDLNASDSECEGTPLLIKSLGIDPELNVSWSANMETPTQTQVSLPGFTRIDEQQSLDSKVKPLQPRHLFHTENNPNKGIVKEMLPSVGVSDINKCEKTKLNSKTEDLCKLLKRPALKFIYPKPIYINFNSKPQQIYSTKQLNQQLSGTNTENQSVMYLDSRQSKNLEEIKTSLDFSSEPVVNDRHDQSSRISSGVALQQKEVHVVDSFSNKFPTGGEFLKQIYLNLDETKNLLFSRNQGEAHYLTSSNDDQEHIETIASRNVLESVGFSTAAGKKVTISEKAMIQARARLEEIDKEDLVSTNNPSTKFSKNLIKKHLHDLNSDKVLHNFDDLKAAGFSTARGKLVRVSDEVMTKSQAMFAEVNEAPSSDVLKLQETVGFSTAGGKKFTISDKAMIRARAKFEEIDEEDLIITKHQVTRNNTKFNNLSEKWVAESDSDCDNMLLQNSDIPKTVGFSSAKGKPIQVSDEAMAKGQTIFTEVDGDPLSNPSSITSAYPETVGFSTAGGKKVVISETAIAQAKSLFSEFDEVNVDPTGIPETACFNRANGNKAIVSKEARGQALLEDVCEKNTADEHGETTKASGKSAVVPKQTLTRSGDSRIRVKTSSFKAPRRVTPVPESASHGLETNEFKAVQIPLTVGFNLASGKEVKISELALSRARKNFEEPLAIEVLPKMVGNVQAVKIHRNSSPPAFPVKDENADKKRKIEEEDDEYNWVSSPTIGKTKKAKKRKNVTDSPQSQLIQMATPGTPSAFESSTVSAKIRALRRKAREEQKAVIQRKQLKGRKPSPKAGYLYQLKKDGTSRKTWKELIGNSSIPEILAPYKLLEDYGMLAAVCQVQASNSSSFNFCAWDHFPIEDCLQNSKGVQLGEFQVIFSDENIIGCEEIGASLLASENVDPTLISYDWIRNHYRWIVWKLASMELRMPSLFARTCLTMKNLLEQLKYRYDKEIDHCERSALRRIIEQDDTAAKTMILCVAEIRSLGSTILELTDGWYSIEAHCDTAMQQLIERNKIFAGLKLVISGAELVSPGPSAPLEKGSDTYLKISANSTRRARWDAKLGFHSNPLPFPIPLASVLPEGGVVSHIRVNVIRVYPIVYMEKAADGKTIFRGERQYRRITESAAMRFERMMEKVVEDIEREEDEQEKKRIRADGNRHRNKQINLTDEEKRSRILAEAQKRMQMNMKSIEGVPMLKLRLVDCRATNFNSAIISIWRPNEELQHHLKEGRAYHLYNVNAAGLRFGELQLNAMKNTMWKDMKQPHPTPSLDRSVIAFSAANLPGFKPMFNELDIVGLVVFVGHQQSKGPFQTTILFDGSTYFGVKCWASLEDYALADIIVVGAFLAFSNLQWRATACRTASKMQFAFIHEGTLVSARPSLKHLDAALNDLKQSVKDPAGCVAEAEGQVDTLLGSATPQSATPKFGTEVSRRGGMFTPTGVEYFGDGKKNETPTSSNVVINRARLLEKYPNPPALSPWNGCASPLVRQKFKPPARKPPAV